MLLQARYTFHQQLLINTSKHSALRRPPNIVGHTARCPKQCDDYKVSERRKSNKPKAFQPTYGSFTKSGAGAEIESPVGEGESFQSISVIRQRLDATKEDAPELKFLHSVIFGNEGEKKSRKKMLLEFKGLSGGSSASTDAMRVRANRLLSEPTTKSMVPALAHILALVELGSVGKTISQIVQFLSLPARKLCTELAAADASRDDEPNGKAQAKQAATKPAVSRKNAKKPRERAPQSEEEPLQKRQRGPRSGKPKAAPKKPAEKKAAKRKAEEVEAEADVEPEDDEEEVEEEDAPQEECEGAEVGDGQHDVEMHNEVPEEAMQEEKKEEEVEEYEGDEEPAPGLGMDPGPPVIGGPPVQPEMPVAVGQQGQHPAFDGVDSQDHDGEESEPPPPGLENAHDLAKHLQPVQGHVMPPQQKAPPVVPAGQRPGIGSQASPCDAAPPGSHGRSQPPQLGPHALQPPLEGVATSGGHAAVSHDNGSVTKVRARGNTSKRNAGRAATKSSLGPSVAPPAGVSKKAAPNSKRGQKQVAAAALKAEEKKPREKGQPPGDLEKLIQQMEKEHEELLAAQDDIKARLETHSARLVLLRKMCGLSSVGC